MKTYRSSLLKALVLKSFYSLRNLKDTCSNIFIETDYVISDMRTKVVVFDDYHVF